MTAPATINEHVFIRRFSVVDYDLFLVVSERVAHFNQECKGDFSLERIADLSHEIIGPTHTTSQGGDGKNLIGEFKRQAVREGVKD